MLPARAKSAPGWLLEKEEDLWSLRQKVNPVIELWIVLPPADYDKHWDARSRERMDFLIRHSTCSAYVSCLRQRQFSEVCYGADCKQCNRKRGENYLYTSRYGADHLNRFYKLFFQPFNYGFHILHLFMIQGLYIV